MGKGLGKDKILLSWRTAEPQEILIAIAKYGGHPSALLRGLKEQPDVLSFLHSLSPRPRLPVPGDLRPRAITQSHVP